MRSVAKPRYSWDVNIKMGHIDMGWVFFAILEQLSHWQLLKNDSCPV